LALIACGRFLRTGIGALIIFLRISSLQATNKNEFVRKFITGAWPIVECDNIVRQSISKSHFLCDKNLYLHQSFQLPLLLDILVHRYFPACDGI
jgi:hypothetical protein